VEVEVEEVVVKQGHDDSALTSRANRGETWEARQSAVSGSINDIDRASMIWYNATVP
jgi:hypothetical protein